MKGDKKALNGYAEAFESGVKVLNDDREALKEAKEIVDE